MQPLRQQAPQSVQPLHQQATIQSRGLPARRSVLALPVDSASQESGDDDDRSDGCPSDFNLSDDDYQSDGCPSDFNGSDDDITAQWRRAFVAFQRLVREPVQKTWTRRELLELFYTPLAQEEGDLALQPLAVSRVTRWRVMKANSPPGRVGGTVKPGPLESSITVGF